MSERDVQRIMVRHNTTSDYVIRLARPITEADDFADEFQILAGAGQNDTVKLLIVSPGGSLDTCTLITKAMYECEAHITGWIGPTCASAGSAVALACDDWEVDEMSCLMIHTASFGDGGKAPEVEASVASKLRQIRRWVTNTYAGFLTEEEIENVIGGRDYWFDVDNGLVERLTAYGEYRDAKRAALYEATHNVEEELDKEPEEAVESTPSKPKRQKKAE